MRSRRIQRELLRTDREEAIRLRDQRRISGDVLRRLEHELDVAETRLQAGAGSGSAGLLC